MFSSIKSGTVYGLGCFLVDVEIDVSRGMPCFIMVGSLGSEVRESGERVRVALKNMDIAVPPAHITVNISPADIRKSGTGFDLPIALGILLDMEMIPKGSLEDTLVLGELGLNGEIKPVSGVMPIVYEGKKQGLKKCIVPVDNMGEAVLVEGINVIGVANIKEVSDYLNKNVLPHNDVVIREKGMYEQEPVQDIPDFSDVVGQEALIRGALVAAAGNHHMLIMGPPGTGKTMIAKRIPGILPPLDDDERLEVTGIYSIAGKLSNKKPVVMNRPFVSPHHCATVYSISGGGSIPGPGALSLAHKGVLFLDELPEFSKDAIEILREPLEEKCINISRAAGTFCYPADIMLIAAMNPCPCGYYPDRNKCNCSPMAVRKYMGRISGPILDRIDICVTAQKIRVKDLGSGKNGPDSTMLRKRVLKARQIQLSRFEKLNISCNAQMSIKEIDRFCALANTESKMAEKMCEKLDISARAYHRMLKVARTIADLDESEDIKKEHLAEALCYRPQIPEV